MHYVRYINALGSFNSPSSINATYASGTPSPHHINLFKIANRYLLKCFRRSTRAHVFARCDRSGLPPQVPWGKLLSLVLGFSPPNPAGFVYLMASFHQISGDEECCITSDDIFSLPHAPGRKWSDNCYIHSVMCPLLCVYSNVYSK